MTTTQEALRLAEEALQIWKMAKCTKRYWSPYDEQALAAIHEAQEQPAEQE